MSHRSADAITQRDHNS